MVIRLRTNMAITHGLIAIIAVFLVIIATYVLINERFLDYLTVKQSKEQQKIVETFRNSSAGNQWDESKVTATGIEALKKGYLVTVKNAKGKIVWEPKMTDEELYNHVLKEIEERILSHFGTHQMGLQSKKYQIGDKNSPIGEIKIEFYSTYFLTDHDFMFIDYLNTSLLGVAGISFLFALLLSAFVSRKMSIQLGTIVVTAQDIANGKKISEARISASNILEIKQLGEAIEQLDQNLREQEASKKRLTADIAHELRTPITTLQSHLEALLEGIWQPTEERLASCHEEILRMAMLVNDLEQLNKYETGQVNLSKNEFEIANSIKNIATNFQRDFEKKQVKFKFSGDNCIVLADREKMGQVIVNLISNSLKYTPEGGRVFINTTCDSNFVCIVVNDNGIGIPSKDLPHIFNRLYRADASRTRDTGGSGIGLSITKAIVEAHGGSIGVVSQEGKGTEVTVIIPRN